MNNLILLSTACYFRKNDDMNNIIKRILKPEHSVNGYGLALLTPDELMNFQPCNEIIELSQNYYNTLHAPAKKVAYKNDLETDKLLNKLKMLSTQLNMKNITFHYNTVEDFEYLVNNLKNFSISLENQGIKDGNNSGLEELLDTYPSIYLTFDVCHAIEFGKEEEDKIIKKYDYKIMETHWSYSGSNFNHDSAAIMLMEINYMLKLIKSLNKPVLIEVDLRESSKHSFIIRKEIQLLKSF